MRSMQPATSAFATLTTKTELRKGYSITGRAPDVEDLPAPWANVKAESNFTITLFTFSWALLPVGFMILMALFDRYQQHRLTLALVAFALLLFSFITGVMQRRSSLLEPRIQLGLATLGATAASLVLLWGLQLESWWWVSYGLVFGTVATMYVGLNHLASCNAPLYRLPWQATLALPADAFVGWHLQRGQWANGVLGTKRLDDGTVVTLFGLLEEGTAYLFVDRLCPASSAPNMASLGVDFLRLASESEPFFSEE